MELERIRNLMPRYFDRIRETDAVLDAEQIQLDKLGYFVSQINDNQFVQTADDRTLTLLERLFGILADRTIEDLSFRRTRLLNLFATAPPFTLFFLYGRLVTLVGRGLFAVTIDYNNYVITTYRSRKNH